MSEGVVTTSETLFPTAAELGVPPVLFHDGDLSRIRTIFPESMQEYEKLHAEMETERKAKQKRQQGIVAGLDAL